MKLLTKNQDVASAVDALAGAEAALVRWTQDSEEKTRSAEALAASVAEAEARAGSEALDDPDAMDRITAELIRLRTQQEIAHRAATLATERLESSRRAVLTAQGRELRDRAAELRRVAAERQTRTDALLAELNTFEATRYEVNQFGSILQGYVNSPSPMTARILHEADYLESLAVQREQCAANGHIDQVLAYVSAAVPQPRPIEVEYTNQ